jgi:hypothetical protein
MKTIIFGAASLLLGTSAYAATPQAKGMSTPASPTVAAKDTDSLDASMIGNAITIDWPAKRADARAIDRKHIITAAKAPLEAPAAETPSTAAMGAAADDATYDGVGGPEESSDAPPVRAFAARDYPPCTSEAQDSCIQLYEPGVSEALASWQTSHGGQQTAMGGPEEPIEEATGTKGAEAAADQPLPEDAVMPASETMVEKDAPDTSAI